MTRLDARGARALIVLVVCFLGVACAKPKPAEFVPFSEKLRMRYAITDAELRELQFYISHQIVLERVAQGGEARVERGRLVARGETWLHQVVVQPGTRGTIEPAAFVGEGEWGPVLEVSFERGAPLRFSPWEPGGAYTLESPPRIPTLAELFGRVVETKRRFEVPFAGDQWWVEAGAAAALLVETDAVERLARTRRVLKGVRAPGAR